MSDLGTRFGRANVFYDLQTVSAGVDYVAKISAALQKAQFTLVIIGPSWAGVTDDSGVRRLDNPYDPVRMEVALALQSKSTLIPILVGGAAMPKEESLPSDIKALARRNAIEIADRRWADDVQSLAASLGGRISWTKAAFAAVALVQIAFLVIWISQAVLQSRINELDGRASAVREQYVAKMQVGSDECMAGKWPAGAIKGPSYQENGNMVTAACSGVSAALDYFQQFFNDDQLWRKQSSRQTSKAFQHRYQEVFGSDISTFLAKAFSSPLTPQAINLAQEATGELAKWAQDVVVLKQRSGEIAENLATLQTLTYIGLYWTAAIGLSFIVWLVRGAVTMRR